MPPQHSSLSSHRSDAQVWYWQRQRAQGTAAPPPVAPEDSRQRRSAATEEAAAGVAGAAGAQQSRRASEISPEIELRRESHDVAVHSGSAAARHTGGASKRARQLLARARSWRRGSSNTEAAPSPAAASAQAEVQALLPVSVRATSERDGTAANRAVAVGAHAPTDEHGQRFEAGQTFTNSMFLPAVPHLEPPAATLDGGVLSPPTGTALTAAESKGKAASSSVTGASSADDSPSPLAAGSRGGWTLRSVLPQKLRQRVECAVVRASGSFTRGGDTADSALLTTAAVTSAPRSAAVA